MMGADTIEYRPYALMSLQTDHWVVRDMRVGVRSADQHPFKTVSL